jgi:hypothetical protein
MSRSIDFLFSIGSTYTYLTVMRVGQVAQQSGGAFRGGPFDVRAIMVYMNNIPYRPNQSRPDRRGAMSSGDVHDRVAGKPALSAKGAALPNRIALVGVREGWSTEYVAAACGPWFVGDHDASTESNLLSGAVAWLVPAPRSFLRCTSNLAVAGTSPTTTPAK